VNLDLAKFKALLLQKEQVLRNDIESGAEAGKTVELDQTKVGRISRMDALQSQAMSQAASRRWEHELKRAGSALNRIDEDDYGYCLHCVKLLQVGG
jgi:DnaK suppressor protein